jgi:uncharacterized damage-inducible protein DinB
MSLTHHLARHLREVYFGGNWTASDLKTQLKGITCEQANTRIGDLNTIAGLVYHIQYYVRAINRVLDGGNLDAKDRYSFDHPPIESEADWHQMLETTWEEAESFARRLEALPDQKLTDTFVEDKYGNYLRNVMGVIEHVHYHLGQIVLLRKLLTAKGRAS